MKIKSSVSTGSGNPLNYGPGFDVLIGKTYSMGTENKKGQSTPASKPDPKTLHKTDPQENMEGPVSSVMQNIKETSEKNDKESKKAADKKKDKNT